MNASSVIILSNVKGVGPKKILKLLEDKNLPKQEKDLFNFLLDDPQKIGLKTLSQTDIDAAIRKRNEIVHSSKNEHINIITILDRDYPKTLKIVEDPPVVLFYKGNISALNQLPGIAIIGTRKPTEYGYQISIRLGKLFGKENFNIVSGLAAGCDTGGHKGALSVSGITTAVMAQPLNKIYPKENRDLAEEILKQNGVLLSEYPVGAYTGRNSFVERDRIQAGLSYGTVVVETDIKGGTMHTVSFTRKYKRKLYAFNHGREHLHQKQTQGNQMLIDEQKAVPIANSNDIEEIVKTLKSDFKYSADLNLSNPDILDHPNETIPQKKRHINGQITMF